MGRRLERHVDFDLTERILASGPIKKITPKKSRSMPRKASTYRGARRNAPRIERAAQLAIKRAKNAASLAR